MKLFFVQYRGIFVLSEKIFPDKMLSFSKKIHGF